MDVVVHVPNSRLPGAGLIENVVWFAIIVEVVGLRQRGRAQYLPPLDNLPGHYLRPR